MPKTAKEIVEEAMPGYRVVDKAELKKDAATRRIEPEATDLDLGKMLGKARRLRGPQDEAAAEVPEEDILSDLAAGEGVEDIETVVVEPRIPSAADRRARRRTILVQKGQIIGEQG